MIKSNIEIWKDIPGYKGRYQASNLGEIKSLNYHRENREKILSQVTGKSGYKRVMLYDGIKRKSFRVNRLIAQTFIPNPDNLPCVNHKDEVKTNNCVKNLEWCDEKYNSNYGNRNIKVSKSKQGHKNPSSRKIMCINTSEIFECIKYATDKYKTTNASGIVRCCKGKQKICGEDIITGQKLKWKYI